MIKGVKSIGEKDFQIFIPERMLVNDKNVEVHWKSQFVIQVKEVYSFAWDTITKYQDWWAFVSSPFCRLEAQGQGGFF